MRLLPKQKQIAVMQNIKTGIPKLTDFYFTPSQAEVITGKQEGIS